MYALSRHAPCTAHDEAQRGRRPNRSRGRGYAKGATTFPGRSPIANRILGRVLVGGRKSLQHFETPPEEVSGDQNAERYLHQLDDKFVFAHLVLPAARPVIRTLLPL